MPTQTGETNKLLIGSADEIASLEKLATSQLPNNATVASLQKQYKNNPLWFNFRNDPNYLYVVNWLFQCRGYLRLASEHFDTDLFEIELFNLVTPPPIDDMVLLVNKVKLALILKVHGRKVTSLAMFESLFRVYFGTDTPLKGSDDDADDNSTAPVFDDLFINEKIEVLSILISEIVSYSDFRDFLDKLKLAPDSLRLPAVTRTYSPGLASAEDYVLAFDNTALYKRTIVTPELLIPKKRKLAPEDPERHYDQGVFDTSKYSLELIYKDIFGLNDFVKELLKNRLKKFNRLLLEVIKKPAFILHIYSYEFRKRRVLASRKREFDMARLMATRKRSSRLEALEHKRTEQDNERKARELELKIAATRRSERSQRTQRTHIPVMDYTEGLTREQRLNMRKDKSIEHSGALTREQSPIMVSDNNNFDEPDKLISLVTEASDASNNHHDEAANEGASAAPEPDYYVISSPEKS